MFYHSLCLRLLAIFSALCISTATATRNATWSPDYVLIATAENITINCQTRYSVIVNGSSPGPTLYMREGQTTWVRVWNRIPDNNFTLHWHGLSQRAAPFSDGTPLVSQWPIAPGEYFDYEVTPIVGDAGSYFYHSHVGFQAATAFGALIVEDAGDTPYQYDDDMILTLGDYYPKNDSVIEKGLLSSPFKWSGEPEAILINDRSGNSSFSNATDLSCTPYIINVTAGQTYRMRFIGRTAISLVTLGIEDHDNLTIIEADGQYTQPFETDHLQVATGQRFSILFTAKTEEELQAANKTQFWLRYENRERPTNVSGYALLQYSMSGSNMTSTNLPVDLPSTPPISLPRKTYDWLEYSLQALDTTNPFPTLSEVTRTIYITVAQYIPDGNVTNGTVTGQLVWGQNHLPWQETRLQNQSSYAPFLVNLYLTGQTPNYTAAINNNNPADAANGSTFTTNLGFDPTTGAFPALVGETLDIVWLSNSGPTGGWDFHPMHAHGAHYWDLGSGNGTYNASQNEATYFANGTFTPAKRDTTILYRYATSGAVEYTAGWRAWRVRVTEDNIGAWMMHCHILQHMIMGMQSVWVFGNASSILAKFPVQPYVQGYLQYGGDAYGNDTFDPLVGLYGIEGDVNVAARRR